MHKIFIVVSLLLLLCFVSFAQQADKAGLEKQRATIQKDIDNIKRSLSETTRNKKTSLAQLHAVQQKLELRQKEIGVIGQQMKNINVDISNRWTDISKLKNELDTLKLQYDKSVIYAYKTRSSYDLLNFVFSANNFNDVLKRISFLKSFHAYREGQVFAIAHTQDLLHKNIAGLNKNKIEKNLILKEEDVARKNLEAEKKEKDEVLNKLSLREKSLNKEIADKKRQDLKISSAILIAINKAKAADLLAAKKNAIALNKSIAAKKNTVVKEKTNETASGKIKETTTEKTKEKIFIPPAVNATTIELSNKFAGNIHNLPWPVASKKIAMRFGPQTIPPNIKIDNKFLTFETDVDEPVKSIFEGEVTMVTNIGGVLAIMIRNGNYITTYCNLSSVSVNQGQQIKTGQLLGKVAEKGNNIGELELGISNSDNKFFDPEKWLR